MILIYFHSKLKNVSKKLKKNSVTLHIYSNRTYLSNQLRNLSLIFEEENNFLKKQCLGR